MDAVTDQWLDLGVQKHSGKDVIDEPAAEIQGAMLTSGVCTLGLSFAKAAKLMQAGLHLLGQFRPSRRAVERLLGKIGYAHTFRPACRASFVEAFRWLNQARERRQARVRWTPALWQEFFEALVFLPTCYMELAAPWSPTVQCTRASGGSRGAHGIAYSGVGLEKGEHLLGRKNAGIEALMLTCLPHPPMI